MSTNPYLDAMNELVDGLQQHLNRHHPAQGHACTDVLRALEGIKQLGDDATRVSRLDELDHLDLGMIRYAGEYGPFTRFDAEKIAHYLADRAALLRDPQNNERRRRQHRIVMPNRQWLEFAIGDHYDGKTELWYR